jgi:hypothetical protein
MTAKDPKAAGELIVDDRGRTSLAKVHLGTRHTRYEVQEYPGGVLVLVPLVTRRVTDLPAGVRDSLASEDS